MKAVLNYFTSIIMIVFSVVGGMYLVSIHGFTFEVMLTVISGISLGYLNMITKGFEQF